MIVCTLHCVFGIWVVVELASADSIMESTMFYRYIIDIYGNDLALFVFYSSLIK